MPVAKGQYDPTPSLSIFPVPVMLGLLCPAGRNQPPEPGKGRWQDVIQTHDAIGRVLPGAGWGTNTETADINRDRLFHNIGNAIPGQDDPGIGAALSRFILNMVPK